MTRRPGLKREDIGDHDAISLRDAAKFGFKDGTMTARKLYKEYLAGHLVIERVGGQTYTTLAEIEYMRKKCRDQLKARDCGDAPNVGTPTDVSLTPPSSSSLTDDISAARDAALMMARELKKHSPRTLPKSTSTKQRKDNVVPLTSRSQT